MVTGQYVWPLWWWRRFLECPWQPKWPKNGQKWPNNEMYDFGMIYLLEEKKPRNILTPFLTISVMNWAPGAYICPLMRYWHFETIFGLALQQNPSAGQNFTHTLIWPNSTLFWKKKWNLRCGVVVAAKMAKNGRKMAKQYNVLFWPKLSLGKPLRAFWYNF